MRSVSKWLAVIVVCGFAFVRPEAQCPKRPDVDTVVKQPLNLFSENGVLSAQFVMGRSVDDAGYTHYCYNYKAPDKIVESPTLRLNPGDELQLEIINRIKDEDPSKPMKMTMTTPLSGTQTCGDGGEMTVSSTNVHYHGLNVPPKCHQDD